MLSNGFFTDAKISQLRLVEAALLIHLFAVASDSSSSSFTLHIKSLPSLFRLRAKSLHTSLTRFQELQLLTFEEMPSLRIELNRIKENRNGIEVTREVEKSLAKTQPSKPKTPELNRKIWDEYRDAYFSRYAVDPVRNASVNGKISQIAARLGSEGPLVVRFYVEHPNTFYVKNLHAIGLCLSDAESLRTQWAKGKPITSADVRNYESNQEHQQLLTAIAEGRI